MKIFGITSLILAVIFGTAGLSYFFTSETGINLLKGRADSTNFLPFLMNDSYKIILISFIIFFFQLTAGHIFNLSLKKKNVEKNYEKVIMFKIFPILYATLEFLVFYLLVVLVLGNVINNFNFSLEPNSPSTLFLRVILWTAGITLFIGVILRALINKWLEFGLISQTSNIKPMLQETYSIIFNFSYLLILPLTLVSIFQQSVSTQEQTLFFQIGTIILAGYLFQISKSKLAKFTLPEEH